MKLDVTHVKPIQSSACGKNSHKIRMLFTRVCSYRCLRCFNYDLCQTCFFTGDHAKKHDGSHPIEEYCKQVGERKREKEIHQIDQPDFLRSHHSKI